MDAKRPITRHIIIKTPKVKDKERTLKAARKVIYLQGSSHKTISWFLKRNFTGYKGLARNTQSHEKWGPTAKITLPSKAIIQNQRADKKLLRQERTKGFHHHQAIIIWNVKVTYLRKISKLWIIKWQKYISINIWISKTN